MSSGNLARTVLSSLTRKGVVSCPHHAHDSSALQRFTARTNSNTVVGDYAFEMVHSTVRFGEGVTQEIGQDLVNMGAKSTCVLTDANIRKLRPFTAVADSLKKNGVNFTVYDNVSVEPTDTSFQDAIQFARQGNFDSFIAVGGGSTMDTAKAASLYAAHPEAEFLDYVTLPFGKGLVPKTAMKPLIAVPTTAGTGSEATTVAIFDFHELGIKSGIRHRAMKPHLAIVDPLNIASMPRNVAIFSGFDVLCHALESYTAKPYLERGPRPDNPANRPVYQGSNPISDVWAREALHTIKKYFKRSVDHGSDDREAQSKMLLASTFAGMGFGNAGVHLCHGLSYPISGQGKKHVSEGYDKDVKLIPHGLSVVTTACQDFKFTCPADPDRHLDAASHLGFDTTVNGNTNLCGAKSSYAGEILAEMIQGYCSHFKIPNGLSNMGFTSSDVDKLTNAAMGSGALRLSPRQETTEAIHNIYANSLTIY